MGRITGQVRCSGLVSCCYQLKFFSSWQSAGLSWASCAFVSTELMITAPPPKIPGGDFTLFSLLVSCQLCAPCRCLSDLPVTVGALPPQLPPFCTEIGRHFFNVALWLAENSHWSTFQRCHFLVKKVLLAPFATCGNFTPLCYFLFSLIFWALPWIWKSIRNMLLWQHVFFSYWLISKSFG